MLKIQLQNIIKRFCHNHSRGMLYLPKPTNPLVECEGKSKSNCNTPCVKETKIYINDNNLIHGQQTLLPVQIQYYDKNTICKITVEIIN
jgi:hypothetical protein